MIGTEPETVAPLTGDMIVAIGVGVEVGKGVGVEYGVGDGTPLITFTVMVEDPIRAVLLLYAFTEILCSPLATFSEFQICVYGGEEAIQLLST